MLLNKHGFIHLEASILPAQQSNIDIKKAILASCPVDPSNPLLYHKTTRREIYEQARKEHPGFDDVILYNPREEITESTVANLFVKSNGVLHTPPLTCGLLPGVFRASLLNSKQAVEKAITISDLLNSSHVFLGNSVRGLYPVQVVAS